MNVSNIIRKDKLELHVNLHNQKPSTNRSSISKPGVNNKNQKQHNTNKLEFGAVYDLFHVNPIRCIPPLITEVVLNNKNYGMELGTGTIPKMG